MPLSPSTPSMLNFKAAVSPSASVFCTPLTTAKMAAGRPSLDPASLKLPSNDNSDWDEETSSPFVTEIPMEKASAPESVQQTPLRQLSPAKETITSLTPGAQLRLEATPFDICEDETSTPAAKPPISIPTPDPASSATQPVLPPFSSDDASELLDMTAMTINDDNNVDNNIDDTCFSTFSEVPNADMTTFARLGNHSPTKSGMFSAQQTPRPISQRTPGTNRTTLTQVSRSPSPTPRRNGAAQAENDTTNLLLDFTQQFEAISSYSQKLRAVSRRSPAKGGDPQLLSYLNNVRSPVKGGVPATPLSSKQTILNLLDFELPPAPTPRSIPSISIRELESLKSSFASEISSLKATLSGREAEVEALKRAVSDAERRVGEAVESAREEKTRRECTEREKEEWERRGREFEDVLKKVKAEVIESEREKTELTERANAAEERVQEAEHRAADAEARATKAELMKVDVNSAATANAAGELEGPVFTAEQVQKQIDEKVHALSTELHAIYKKKHVTKVAGLKKGFEAKTKEKTTELQSRIEELEKLNEDLQTKLDGTLSGVLPTNLDGAGVSADQREAERKKLEEQAAEIERQRAEIVGREEELKTARTQYGALMKDLERERVEKNELVAAVDEMLALQADVSVLNVANEPDTAEEATRRTVINSAVRPTGVPSRPGSAFGFGGPSKIAPPSGLAKPVAGKSRMMSNIERMGGGRFAD